MALRLFISNQTEKLAGILAEGLLAGEDGYRASDPLRKTRIIVQSQGMEIWLKQYLVKSGVPVINFEYPFVLKGVKDILAANFGFQEVEKVFRRYSESAMIWSIDSVLRDDAGSFFTILPAAGMESAAIQRFEFARCAASEFDRLQTYRPEILEAWEAGKDIACSGYLEQLPELWRRLRAVNADCPCTRSLLIKNFLQLPQPANVEPLSVFGIGAMPEMYFQVFAKNASVNTVNFFYTNICREYWSFHPLKKEKLSDEEKELLPDGGNFNPLISACGHRNREFFQCVEKVMGVENVQWQEYWSGEEPDSLLAEVQNEILSMSMPTEKLPCDWQKDDSLSIHGAFSNTRQVEIVHDMILDAVNSGEMQMNDILVLAPDIGVFARDIQAVFGSGPLSGCFTVTDRNTEEHNTLAGCLKALIEAAKGRFELQNVCRLLQRGMLMQNFNLTAASVADIEKALYRAGVRWGIDETMRQEECLVPFADYSWRAGLDRIFAGLALVDDAQLAPVRGFDDVEKLERLAGILRFLRRLELFRNELKGEKTPADWNGIICRAINDFAGKYADMTEKNILQRALAAITADAAAGGCGKNLYSFDVFYSAVKSSLAVPPPYTAFLSGKITFSSIMPMRNIPCKMIVMMGMDDGKFPRRDEVRNIDVFGTRRPGERSRAFEDRAVFLETLLAARKQFAVIFNIRPPSGRGDDIPPAVPVKEVLSYLQNTRIDGGNCVVKHPAYGFSRKNFTGEDKKIFSYSGKYLELAETNCRTFPDFCGTADKGNGGFFEPESFSIAEISSFLRKPQEYFLRHNLDMYTGDSNDVFDNSEVFGENHLLLAGVKNELGREINTGGSQEKNWEKISRQAVLPVGCCGRMIFDRIWQDCRIHDENLLAEWGGQEKTVIEINLPAGDKISGLITAKTDLTGIVRCCFKGIKTKDIISFYVEYLVLAANKDEADGVVTGKLVGTKDRKIYHLSGINRSNAVEILGKIIGLMKKSRSECPELFGVSSIKFVLGSWTEKVFSGGDYYYDEYDRSDFAVRKCFSNDPDLSNSENFVQTAEDIYGVLRCHCAVEELVHDRT